MAKPAPEITSLLDRFQQGDEQALEKLMPIVYEQLKKIARGQLARRSGSPTLSPTALVHEVFLKYSKRGELAAKNRVHFYAMAAKCMRWLLADYARAKHADKRGGPAVQVAFDEQQHAAPAVDVDLVRLHNALEKLRDLDPALCSIVEMRFIVGLSVEETAEATGVSARTIKRQWTTARAWLLRELENVES